MHLLERERKARDSYFSWLPQDLTSSRADLQGLTKWLIPLFLGHYVDSSSWAEGTFQKTSFLALDAPVSDPFTQRVIRRILRPVKSQCRACQVWYHPSKETFLTLNYQELTLYQLTEEGWTEQTLIQATLPGKVAFDVEGKIYFYYPPARKLYLFSADGIFLQAYDYTHLKVRLQEFCVIRGEVFFTSGSAVIRWNLLTNRLVWLAEDFPLMGSILTDYHSYFLLKYSRHVLIFDLRGLLRHHLALGDYFSLFLHPQGDLQIHFQYPDEGLTIYSAK